MKTILALRGVFAALLAALPAAAQPKDPSQAVDPAPPEQGPPPGRRVTWRAIPRDWCSTDWLTVESATNEATGQIQEESRHRYVAVGDSLNYLDESGRWRPAEPKIEAGTNGAAVLRMPTRIHWARNINTEGAVTVISKSNTVSTLRPVGLFYYDAESNESIQLAAIQDSEGEIQPGQDSVVFRSVLDSLRADLVYRLSPGGTIESDLLLLEKPRPPQAYHLKERSTRLEFWHTLDGEPELRRTPVVLGGETDPALRARMAEPDIVDEMIELPGDLWLPRGYGFSVSAPGDAAGDAVPRPPGRAGETRPGRVPVAKRLVKVSDGEHARTVLVESVPVSEIREQLEALPQAYEGAGLSVPASRGFAQRFGQHPPGGLEPAAALSPTTARVTRGRRLPVLTETAALEARPMRVAATRYEPRGFCLDYIIVSGSGSYTFSANTTYYLNSSCNFNSAVAIYSGAVIKRAPGALLTVYTGYLYCYGAAIITSADENIYGETIAGSTGNPSIGSGGALSLYYTPANMTASNLRIRWAGRGLTAVHSSPASRTYTVSGCAFEYCTEGIYADRCTLVIQNSTQCSVPTPVNNNGSTVSGSLGVSCEASLGEAVDQPGWPFSTGGSGSWYCQSGTAYSGGDAAQSALITHNQSTWFQTTLTGPGTVSFHWKVSSEYNYDYLRFYVDGTQQGLICGEQGWTPASFPISPGTHTVQWSYTKDGSVNTGADAGWVDAVQFGTICTPPSISAQPASQTAVVGDNVTFTVSANGSPTLTYQWRYNGANITGATGPSHTIYNTQQSHAGNYSVVVGNPCGSATSSDAVLTVVTAPACVSPPSGLISWWPGNGALDDVAGGLTATALGAVGYASGKVSQAFQFSGANQNLEVANAAPLNPAAALTLEAWVYPTGNTYSHRDIISKDGEWSERQYLLTASDANRFRPHVWLNNGPVYFDGSTSVLLNTWYHVAMTYDGATLRLYVNGAADGSYTPSPGGNVVTTPQPVRIGGGAPSGAPGYYFAGLIDEPSIYNRALSASEIQGIYSARSAGKCLNPDSDNDGLPDSWERQYFGNLSQTASGDYDGDSLTNQQEHTQGTNPTLSDTDGDGVSDGTEVIQGRNPLVPGTVQDTGVVNLQIFTPLR
jgi:hypothetical protein